MTMTNLDGKIDDTVETLNSTAQRRSLNGDEKFLADLIARYRQLEKEKEALEDEVKSKRITLDSNRAVFQKTKAANAELLAALKDIKDIADLNQHWSCRRIKEIAEPLYNKHKGE